jgi:hypothetical protein
MPGFSYSHSSRRGSLDTVRSEIPNSPRMARHSSQRRKIDDSSSIQSTLESNNLPETSIHFTSTPYSHPVSPAPSHAGQLLRLGEARLGVRISRSYSRCSGLGVGGPHTRPRIRRPANDIATVTSHHFSCWQMNSYQMLWALSVLNKLHSPVLYHLPWETKKKPGVKA